MSSAPKYFMYFPGNYRWSAAFVNMLGTAPFGGADMSELHAIGRLLDGKSGDDDEAWFDACVKIADRVRDHAEKFRDGGHAVSASSFYLRACNYYQMGERFRTPKDARALDAYRAAVDCFHRFIALSGRFQPLEFEVGRFVLFSSRDSVGGGPYLVEQAYPLAA